MHLFLIMSIIWYLSHNSSLEIYLNYPIMYRYENNLSNKCDQLLIENRKNALLIFLLFSLKLRITVWSLTDKSVSYMKYPKSIEKCNKQLIQILKQIYKLTVLTIKGYIFTNDGKYMLLAERRDCKDYCSIFSCGSWELLKVQDTF